MTSIPSQTQTLSTSLALEGNVDWQGAVGIVVSGLQGLLGQMSAEEREQVTTLIAKLEQASPAEIAALVESAEYLWNKYSQKLGPEGDDYDPESSFLQLIPLLFARIPNNRFELVFRKVLLYYMVLVLILTSVTSPFVPLVEDSLELFSFLTSDDPQIVQDLPASTNELHRIFGICPGSTREC